MAEWSMVGAIVVGGTSVAVGGTDVAVGGTGVAEGVTGVKVGGMGVAVGAAEVWKAWVSACADRLAWASADHSGVATVPQAATNIPTAVRAMNLIFIEDECLSLSQVIVKL
jgi:hypothetical protein